MTRIGISGLFILPGRVGGAEYMLYNLVAGLDNVASQQGNDDSLTLFLRQQTAALPPLNRTQTSIISGRLATNRFAAEQVVLQGRARQFDTLLFPNYFTPALLTRCRLVTIIHDVQYRYFPDNFSRQKRAWLRTCHELTLRRAQTIVAISGAAKADLLRFYGERFADKISVISNPVSWDRFACAGTASDSVTALTDRPFVLSVAAHYPHKNLETLIAAFAIVRRSHPECRLILVGQSPDQIIGTARTSRSHDVARDLGLGEAVAFTGHISDAELGFLYRRATMFAFPSLFEGFGMPPIEALGMGLPVLTTQCASIPEVTMGYAQYVDDPLDVHEFAARMSEMLDHPARFRPKLDEISTIRQRYAPAAIAADYYKLLVAQ